MAISDDAGKLYHSVLRSLLLPFYTASSPESQCCGIASRSCDVATHMVRYFQAACTTCKLSYALVCVDVRGAFDSVLRPLVLGSGMHPTALHDMFSRFGAPCASIQ